MLDRKEVRGAIWGVHSTTDRPAGDNTGRLFLTFGGPVCADRISNCPLDRVLTYKNLIYLLNLQFWPTPLFKSQLVKDGEDFLLKKAHLKTLRVLDPIKTSLFMVPTTTRKEAPTGNAPVGAIPLKAVINRFPQVRGNQTSEAPGVVFDLTLGDEGMETPPPNDSLQASLSPPVGGRLRSFRRLANKQMFRCVKHYQQWLRSSIHLKTKFSQSLSDSVRLQGPSKRTLTSCIQSLLSKNAIERVENVKSLGFYSHLFLVPKPHQRWRPVIDLSRLNIFLLVERFKMEMPESIRASLIPGEWVSLIDLADAYLHIPIHPNSRK